MMAKNRVYFFYVLAAVGIICVDQITKQIAFTNLYGKPPVDVLPFFQWVMVFNRGAAFGFLNDSGGWQHFLFGGLAVGVSVFILIWLRRTYLENKMLSTGLTLILGGAIGNLIDRLLHQHVIDFIALHYNGWYFPAFNVADIAITCGAILLIADSLGLGSKKQD